MTSDQPIAPDQTSAPVPPTAPAGVPREKVTGRRIVAALIDLVLLGAVFYVLAKATGDTSNDDGTVSVSLNGGPAVLFFVIVLAYYTILEAMRGQTLGKMVMGIRVVAEDTGSTPSFGRALVRNVLRIIDGLVIYLVGLITIAASKKDQRVGDMAANTLVVRA